MHIRLELLFRATKWNQQPAYTQPASCSTTMYVWLVMHSVIDQAYDRAERHWIWALCECCLALPIRIFICSQVFFFFHTIFFSSLTLFPLTADFFSRVLFWGVFQWFFYWSFLLWCWILWIFFFLLGNAIFFAYFSIALRFSVENSSILIKNLIDIKFVQYRPKTRPVKYYSIDLDEPKKLVALDKKKSSNWRGRKVN